MEPSGGHLDQLCDLLPLELKIWSPDSSRLRVRMTKNSQALTSLLVSYVQR